MDSVGDEKAGQRPGGEAGPRPAQSGEGSRSAMEQLIQQERTRRDAQLPREDGGPADADPAARAAFPLSAPVAGTGARCPDRGRRT